MPIDTLREARGVPAAFIVVRKVDPLAPLLRIVERDQEPVTRIVLVEEETACHNALWLAIRSAQYAQAFPFGVSLRRDSSMFALHSTQGSFASGAGMS